jgi:hypothetical protein
MREAKLGIDIGRVIIGGGDEPGADTRFLDGDERRAMSTPAVQGAFPTIAELVRAFAGRVWLVSKAGARVQDRTRRWLDANSFYTTTGVARTHLRFCRERPQKADHARELGLTHFIDDRFDVLLALRGVVDSLLLFGPQRRPPSRAEWLSPAPNWRAARELLLDAQGKIRNWRGT